MAESTSDSPHPNVNNDFALGAGQNLPNHSTSIAGRGRFVRQTLPTIPTFRTKQEAFRYAAWLITLANVHLPDEDAEHPHTFEEVLTAVQNT